MRILIDLVNFSIGTKSRCEFASYTFSKSDHDLFEYIGTRRNAHPDHANIVSTLRLFELVLVLLSNDIVF